MTRVCWTPNSRGRYEIDIALGSMPERLMIDTGLVDVRNQVAFDLDPSIYDALEQSTHLTPAKPRFRTDASGVRIPMPCGLLQSQLIDPNTGTPLGPVVRALAFRGFAGVPSRVGVAFFHALTGCRVDWDLTARLWCVECP